MKKELWAMVLLTALVLLSAWNIYSVNRLTDRLLEQLDLSQAALEAGRLPAAKKELERALELWLRSDGYTHIFLRHSEIDAAADAFCELGQALDSDPENASHAYMKLRYHLHSIAAMEMPSLRSVL